MKVLLAINDRDLLFVLQRLVQMKNIYADSSFDGIQALTNISQINYDLVVVDDKITLLPSDKVLSFCHEKGVKTLLLRSRHDDALQSDMDLYYPFVYDEFYETLDKLLYTEQSKEGENV